MLRSGISTIRLPIVILSIGLLAAACTDDGTRAEITSETQPDRSGGSTTTAASSTTDANPETSTTPPTTSSEVLEWTPCGRAECTTVQVPVDYDDPSAGMLDIAVGIARSDAEAEEHRGVLFVNPGGPGGSGLDFIGPFVSGFFPSDLADRFDIVSFDPRGVGSSEPQFACGSDGEQLDLTNTIDGEIDTPEEVATAEDAVDLCVESMGTAAGRLHTDHVARDMDVIRSALGEDRISYLGFSYGSTIGAWYATLFPDRVDAMVLDGARNPIEDLSTREVRVQNDLDEIRQFAVLLDEALAACDSPACPIHNDGDPIGYFLSAVEKLDLVNAELADNPSAGALGVITTLYSETTWPQLWQALAELQENDDPTLLALFADFQFGGEAAQASVTAHINCLDDWAVAPTVDRATRVADNEVLGKRIEDEFPLLWALGVDSFDACPYYDTIAPAALDGPLDGGDVPIIVIGNRSDPATPFVESEELATTTLSNGYLVETTHFQHTVYPLNDCVNDVVHSTLIDRVLPASRRVVCPAS